MADDWRRFRPAIWLAMIGIAVLLVANVFVGIGLLGGAIGVAGRIARGPRRRRVSGRRARTPKR